MVFTVLVVVYTKGLYKQNQLIRPYVRSSPDWSRHAPDLSTNITKISHKRNEQHGYVFVLSYSGQQGAGIQALTSLQCWVASFNLPMFILEPILSRTVFVSFPRNLNNTQFVRFSDMFDIKHFNRISKSSGYALVGTREDFFTAAPRNAIYVYVKLARREKIRPPRLVWSRDSQPDGQQQCYHFEDGRLAQLDKEGFCFVRLIEATCSQRQNLKITDKDVRELIFGEWLPQHVTLIFSKWKTPWYVANNELDDPYECKKVGKSSNKEQFLPSPRLISDTQYYEKHFLSSASDSVVALMLRLERMIEYVQQARHSTEWTVDKCLTEAFKTTKNAQTSGYPLVTMDLGKFGSSSFRYGKHITDKSKSLLSKLYNKKFTFEEWEESFTNATGGVENGGYIAALQRTLASRAKCLILVGGGNFQDLALKDYLKNHPQKQDQCIHLVCVRNDEILSEVMKEINDQ